MIMDPRAELRFVDRQEVKAIVPRLVAQVLVGGTHGHANQRADRPAESLDVAEALVRLIVIFDVVIPKDEPARTP